MNVSSYVPKSQTSTRDFRVFNSTAWVLLFRRRIASLIVLVACLMWVFSATPLWSQTTTASIVGTVTDPTQAVIPNATVTATNASTGVASSTTSDSSGHYAFLSLPIGTYDLRIATNGFQPSNISGVTLRVDQLLTQNVTLRPGGGNQTVTVQATPTLVDTTSASLGTVVSETAILNMPLNLREVGALALLVPGTVDTTGRSLATGTANGSGFNDMAYSGSGGGSGGNVLLIDGMISRALNNSSFALDPPPEMVHEFKIQNNIYDASFGMSAGTVMNLVTNSGTNQIHGSAWEYARNSAMDATGYFALTRPDLSRHQFGGAMAARLLGIRCFTSAPMRACASMRAR